MEKDIKDLFDQQFHQLASLKHNTIAILTKLTEAPLTSESLQEKINLAKLDAQEFLKSNQKRVDSVISLIRDLMKRFGDNIEGEIIKTEKMTFESEKSYLKSFSQN